MPLIYIITFNLFQYLIHKIRLLQIQYQIDLKLKLKLVTTSPGGWVD